MGTTLNRRSFEQMIAENIKWIKAHPDYSDSPANEGSHTVLCLNAVVKHEYETAPERNNLREVAEELQKRLDEIGELIDSISSTYGAGLHEFIEVVNQVEVICKGEGK